RPAGHAPYDAVHHARTRSPARRAAILEERDVGARAPVLIGKEHVVHARVVLVHGLADEAQAQHARVEVDVLEDVTGDAGDVVHAFESHDASPSERDSLQTRPRRERCVMSPSGRGRPPRPMIAGGGPVLRYQIRARTPSGRTMASPSLQPQALWNSGRLL